MIGILLVSENSEYAQHNGETFTILKVKNNALTILIDHQEKDFTFYEIRIVEYRKHLQTAYENYKYSTDDPTVHSYYTNLQLYGKMNHLPTNIDTRDKWVDFPFINCGSTC